MTTQNIWDDVRRIADELQLKIHLAGMDARDRWHALEPRLHQIERSIARAGNQTTKAVEDEITSIAAALRRLRDDLARP